MQETYGSNEQLIGLVVSRRSIRIELSRGQRSIEVARQIWKNDEIRTASRRRCCTGEAGGEGSVSEERTTNLRTHRDLQKVNAA